MKISPSAGQIQPVEPMSPSAESPDHVTLLSKGRKGADLPEGSENFRAKSRLSIFFLIFLYSQAPDVPELSHQIFLAFTAQHELLRQNGETNELL